MNVPVQPQHLSEDEDEHHSHEHFGLEHVCPYTLYITLIENIPGGLGIGRLTESPTNPIA